jgi:predicted adenylyl cyclase CyaB
MAAKLNRANIEIKTICRNFDTARVRLAKLGAKKTATLIQRDIYYNHPKLRRKMRIITDSHTELIDYRRADAAELRPSQYRVKKVVAPLICHAWNRYRYGIKVVVDKQREVWQWKSVRIHLDFVTGLGKFLELETVLTGREALREAKKQSDTVVAALQLDSSDYLSKSYSDLMNNRKQANQ